MLLRLVCLLLITWASARQQDAFSTLGVKRGASDKEIKAAYRKLSLQYHPDKNPETKDKFIEISEAYEQIGDAKSRRNYLQDQEMHGRQGHARHFHQRRSRHQGHAHGEDIFEAFERQFGQEFSRANGGRDRGRQRREFRFQSGGGGGGGQYYSYSSHDEFDWGLFGLVWSIGKVVFLPLLSTMGPLIMLLIYCCCSPSGRGGREEKRKQESGEGGDTRDTDAGAGADQQLPTLRDLNVPKGVIIVASLDEYSESLIHLASPTFKHDSALKLCRCENGINESEESEEMQEGGGPRFRGISVCSRGHVFFTGLSHESDEDAVAEVVMWIEKLIAGELSWKPNEELAWVDDDGEEEKEEEKDDDDDDDEVEEEEEEE